MRVGGLLGFLCVWRVFFLAFPFTDIILHLFSQLNLSFRICLNLRFSFDILPSILPSQIHSVMHNTNHKKRKVNTVTEQVY